MGWLVFMGWVISQANEVGGSFQLFPGAPELGHQPLFGLLCWALEPSVALMGVSLS